ncbi:MAG TPA: SpvB/TcaC N-terminal domain-containing protein [Chitinophagaceae bacterium]|nr:SpvB/TcaC N-terminal domain-containing protein [Chitinophagaceae bacterium]
MEKISAPKVSLPSGGGAVKGIGETFHSNAFSGTVNYTVPLPITEGRGYAPSLNLSYSSGSGNGPFGIGWQTSFPTISTRTEKRIPRYNGTDVYMFTGEELVEKLHGTRMVTDNGAQWAVTEYLPRVQGDHTHIERWTSQDGKECYWKTINTQNEISIFGRSKDARIYDPNNEQHIFTWLLESSTDPKGNKILFRYKAEDLVNTNRYGVPPEKDSTAQKYLSHLLYGNYVNHAGAETFAFEIVFDYGEHDLSNLGQPGADPYATPFTWQCRPDPFSSFRSGFEIRTYRRCLNILLFHRFENENNDKPFLVFRTALDYYASQDYAGMPDQTGIMSCLKQLTVTGCRITSNGSYELLSKPALDFTFSVFDTPADAIFKQLNVTGGSLPGFLDASMFLPIDLNGEGLPGLLCSNDSGFQYYSPLGNGQFTAPEILPSFPVEGSTAITDLDGNGLLDMLVTEPTQAGYYEHGEHGWEAFKPFSHYPVSEENTEPADLDADGKSDLVLVQRDSLTVYPSIGTEGFATPQTTLAPEGFPLQKNAYPGELVTFTDLFGDGLAHRVRIANGVVECWPCLGYGVFGEKIVLENAPYFQGGLNTARLFLADITGTGATDIVYANTTHVQIFLNKSGNSFSEPISITLPESFDTIDRIVFLDLQGTGGISMIFTKIEPTPRHYYLDFNGNSKERGIIEDTLKPYLLVKVDNNMGGDLAFHYSSSTKFYLEDKKTGRPWATRLHFPVQVLDRVIQSDKITGTLFSQEYSYHDGYYDPVERAFRGFGLVENRDTQTFEKFHELTALAGFPINRLNKELYVPPVYTKTWYSTGAFETYEKIAAQYKQEFFQGDPYAYAMPDNYFPPDIHSADAETFRQAYVALAGQELRKEVYGEDGTAEASVPFAVTQSNYSVVLVQAKGDQPYAVFRVDPREEISYHYERNALDPRVQQEFTLAVDPLCGQVASSCTVYLPRRAGSITGVTPYPEQSLVQATIQLTDYIDTDIQDGMYWRGIVCQNKKFQLEGLDLKGNMYLDFNSCNTQATQALQNIVPYGKTPQPGVLQACQFEWDRIYFWDDVQHNFLPLFKISSLGLLAYNESAQFTQEYIDEVFKGKMTQDVITNMGGYVYDAATGYWWNKGMVQAYFDSTQPELFHLVKEVYNPFADPASELSVKGTMAYDSPYNMTVIELTEYIDPATDLKNVQHIVMDYIASSPKQLVDVNGNVAQVLYDPLGQVTVTTLFAIKNGQLEGGMVLYPYQQLPAEYQPRIKDPNGNPITPDSLINNPEYYLQGAVNYYFYDEHAWKTNGQPASSVGLTRNWFYHSADAQATPYCRTMIEYTNGLGLAVEEKTKVDAGIAYSRTANGIRSVATDSRWQVSGRTVYNNKGLVAEQYFPYFSDTFHYESQQEITDSGLVPPPTILHYDAVGRLIRQDDPKGFFSKTIITAWEEHRYDKNDTVLDAPYYITFMKNYPANPTQEQKDEKDALDKAAKCYNTPIIYVFDNTGVQFLDITDNLGKLNADSFTGITGNTGITSKQVYDELIAKGYVDNDGWLTRKFTPYQPAFKLQLDPLFDPLITAITELLLQGVLTAYTQTDIQSRIVLQADARLYYSNQSQGTSYYNVRYTYATTSAEALITDSSDAGLEMHFANLLGLLTWSWSARNYNQLITYDRLQRKKELRVNRFQSGDPIIPHDQYPLVEALTYGEAVQDGADRNLRGRVYEIKDLSGIVTQDRYTLTGLPVNIARQMTSVYKDAIDWNDPGKVPLEPAITSSLTYNAIGKIITELTQDGTLTQRTYGLSGQPLTIKLKLPDNTEKPVINNITYNAANQRMVVLYANNTSSRYTYEDTTQRLLVLKNTRKDTTGGGIAQDPDLQNITYVYDPMGNITRTRDLSRDTVFYNNEKVEPLSDYEYDPLYRLTKANGYQHPGILANTYWNDVKYGDFKQSKFSVTPSDYSALENYTEEYRYDNSGNLIYLKHSAKSAIWVRDEELAVEPGSNRLSKFTYDESGNLRQIMINKPVDLMYNCCENLVKTGIITRPDQPDDADYYVYDIAEKRTRKVCESMANGGASTVVENTVYFNNYEVKLQQTHDGRGNATTSLERQTLRVMDNGNCVLMMHYWTQDNNKREMPAGTRSFRWQLQNLQGSASVEVDDNAQVISYEEYFPYGGTAIIAGPNQQEVSLKTYRYTGKERDDTTGLYYYGRRYYATWLARWMNADPIGTADGLNMYAFVGGNPLTYTDSVGLSKKRPKTSSSSSDDSSGDDLPEGTTLVKGGKVLKRSKKMSKKERGEKTSKARENIEKRFGKKMVQKKKIHQSDLLVGTKEVKVKPNKSMSPERLFVRHISTALLSQNKEMVEVQAAISHATKTVYIASNKKQNELFNLLSTKVENFVIPTGSYGTREDRHIRKLKDEIKGTYKDYKIIQVVGHEDQHAETKIHETGVAFDFIGGTRRPCFACSLYFRINKVPSSTYNPHEGAYWNANASLLSLGPFVPEILKLDEKIYEGHFYMNAGLGLSEVHDYDTDSEGDD